jgi:hypothetical protein
LRRGCWGNSGRLEKVFFTSELCNIYYSPDTTKDDKLRRMRWAGRVEHMVKKYIKNRREHEAKGQFALLIYEKE